MSARRRMYLWAGTLIALSLLSLTLLPPRRTLALGYFLGSLSAQVTLAAAWAALGSPPVAQRLILSIGWVFSIWLAVGINVGHHSGPNGAMAVVGVLLLVQFLLLQIPMWSLVLAMGLQLRHRDDTHPDAEGDAHAVHLRFGVRHLFLIMSMAGLLLGIGRVLFPLIDMSGGHEMPIFVFLAVAGVVMTFPLLVATLMRRMVVLGVFLSLLFVGAVTVAELPLFQQLGGQGPGGDDFIAINTASAFVVLAIASVVRLHGYSLQRKPRLADLPGHSPRAHAGQG